MGNFSLSSFSELLLFFFLRSSSFFSNFFGFLKNRKKTTTKKEKKPARMKIDLSNPADFLCSENPGHLIVKKESSQKQKNFIFFFSGWLHYAHNRINNKKKLVQSAMLVGAIWCSDCLGSKPVIRVAKKRKNYCHLMMMIMMAWHFFLFHLRLHTQFSIMTPFTFQKKNFNLDSFRCCFCCCPFIFLQKVTKE